MAPRTIPLRDRARYLAQHWALALATGPLMELWHVALGRRPTASHPFDVVRVLRRLGELLALDLRHVEEGHYPRELLFQLPAGDYARRLPEAVLQAPRILWRRQKRSFLDLGDVQPGPGKPRYYLQTFHWQSDGWLSDRSARLYDLTVELLFLWAADIMRRMAIPAVLEATRDLARPRIVDLACGTGRFLRQLRRAHPDAVLLGVDLSRPYLRHAAAELEREAPPTAIAWVEANAEQLALADGSVDAVTSIFLLHELPARVRRRVLAEAFRVLRPGGRIVLCDAAQPGDSPELHTFFEAFPRLYHEPYFAGYLRDDLGALLGEAGFEGVESAARFVSKVVVARRPDGASRPA